jgi:glycosyltransferase involved in cell wall biosynthesis
MPKKINIHDYFKFIKHGFKEIETLFHKENYDLCFCSTFHIYTKTNIDLNKVVFIQHNDASFYDNSFVLGSLGGKLTVQFMKLFYHCVPIFSVARNIVSFTHDDQLKIEKRFHCNNAKFFNIPLSCDVNNLPLIDKPNNIVYCGRVDKDQKNIFFLFKLAKYLKTISNMKVIVYGKSAIKDDINAFDNVEYRGGYSADKDLAKIYTTAKYSINVSRFEGFPYTLIESLSYGVPIITRDTYTCAKFLTNSNANGILVPRHLKPKAIPQYLNEQFQKINYTQMQQNCLDFVRKNLSTELINKQLVKMIEAMLSTTQN